jgi:hypothetical protein
VDAQQLEASEKRAQRLPNGVPVAEDLQSASMIANKSAPKVHFADSESETSCLSPETQKLGTTESSDQGDCDASDADKRTIE